MMIYSKWDPNNPKQRTLTQPVKVGGHRIPSGFTWNGASVPRILYVFLPRWGKNEHIYLKHDHLYSCQNLLKNSGFVNKSHEYIRKYSDLEMLEDLKRNKIGFLRRYLIYYCVRLFGSVK